MTRPPSTVRDYLAKIGAEGGKKGGKATGQRKARSPEHYAKMVKARKAKRAASEAGAANMTGDSASNVPPRSRDMNEGEK